MEDVIRKYIHNKYYGSVITKEIICDVAKEIVSNNIVDNISEKDVITIIKKYLRYSKKKDIYYFETTKVIKNKSLSPPK